MDDRLRRLLDQMHTCPGVLDLDVYALEVQLVAPAKLKTILAKCDVNGVGNPRSVAIIREARGKVLIEENKFSLAYTEFFEAFRLLSDSGNLRAPTVLCYCVLANVLSLSAINPFNSREARAYMDNPYVAKMYALRAAYERVGIEDIINILASEQIDEYIKSHATMLIHAIQMQMLEQICKVYTKIRLEKIADLLKTNEPTRLAIELITFSNRADVQLSDEFLLIQENNEYAAINEILQYSASAT